MWMLRYALKFAYLFVVKITITVVDYHLQAPLLIWPQNFEDPNSLALIGDLGQVYFSTVSRVDKSIDETQVTSYMT